MYQTLFGAEISLEEANKECFDCLEPMRWQRLLTPICSYTPNMCIYQLRVSHMEVRGPLSNQQEETNAHDTKMLSKYIRFVNCISIVFSSDVMCICCLIAFKDLTAIGPRERLHNEYTSTCDHDNTYIYCKK